MATKDDDEKNRAQKQAAANKAQREAVKTEAAAQRTEAREGRGTAEAREKAGGTKPGAPVVRYDPFSGKPTLQQRVTPAPEVAQFETGPSGEVTTIPRGPAEIQEEERANAANVTFDKLPNAFLKPDLFESRFNPPLLNQPSAPAVDRMGRPLALDERAAQAQLGGPTAENLAAAPFSPAATTRPWMPSADRYANQYRRLTGDNPYMIGNAALLAGGGMEVPTLNEQAVAQEAARKFKHQDAQLARMEDMARKTHDPDRALRYAALRRQLPQAQMTSDALERAYLAEEVPEVKQALTRAGMTGAPDIATTNMLNEELARKQNLFVPEAVPETETTASTLPSQKKELTPDQQKVNPVNVPTAQKTSAADLMEAARRRQRKGAMEEKTWYRGYV